MMRPPPNPEAFTTTILARFGPLRPTASATPYSAWVAEPEADTVNPFGPLSNAPPCCMAILTGRAFDSLSAAECTKLTPPTWSVRGPAEIVITGTLEYVLLFMWTVLREAGSESPSAYSPHIGSFSRLAERGGGELHAEGDGCRDGPERHVSRRSSEPADWTDQRSDRLDS